MAFPSSPTNGQTVTINGIVYQYNSISSTWTRTGVVPIGNQGFQGAQGSNTGFQGFQGNQGFQGRQGAQGYQGSTGSQGFQGYQGDRGFQGFQGPQGYQGAQGNQGVQGNQGFQGFQGNQGYTGSFGSQGNQGFQGFQGNQGYTGSFGYQGFQGQGNQGFQGAGFQGNQGYQGYQGANGPGANQTLNTNSIVTFNDIYAVRTSNTGVIFLGSDGAHYLYFNGSSYQMPSAGLDVYGTIQSLTGDIIAYANSDIRLKTNIEHITDALKKVNTLDGITYNWNELATDKDPTVREAGLIAQQINDILPEIATTRDNGYMAIKYERVVPLLVEAIKELSKEVEELKKSKN